MPQPITWKNSIDSAPVVHGSGRREFPTYLLRVVICRGMYNYVITFRICCSTFFTRGSYCAKICSRVCRNFQRQLSANDALVMTFATLRLESHYVFSRKFSVGFFATRSRNRCNFETESELRWGCVEINLWANFWGNRSCDTGFQAKQLKNQSEVLLLIALARKTKTNRGSRIEFSRLKLPGDVFSVYPFKFLKF